MTKNGHFFIGIIVVWAVIMFGFAGCDNGISGDGGGNGGSSKPAALRSNASYNEALAKVNEIITYCNTHPGTGGVNRDGYRLQAEAIRTLLTTSGARETWNSSLREPTIQNINTVISYLE
jgi:hypothetical protein